MKNTKDGKSNDDAICSFCERGIADVVSMLVTANATICRDCSELVHQAFIQDDMKEGSASPSMKKDLH